jgi:hypothetical protein
MNIVPDMKPRSYQLFAILPLVIFVCLGAVIVMQHKINDQTVSLIDEATDKLSPKVVFVCLQQAYPDQVSDVRYDSGIGQWLVSVGDKDFAWAHGRLLPPERREDWESYRPSIDYVYPWEAIDPESLPAEVIERFKDLPKRQGSAPPSSLAFVTALYGGSTHEEVWEMQAKTRFLGKQVTVHKMLVEPLSRVEATILQVAAYSPEVKRFLENLYSVDGFNWRTIKGQSSFSYHSFGIAVDLLPKGFDSMNLYWQWVMEIDPDWATLPLSKRWSPPREVIQAFEDNGFIWGGKWVMYDTMHFEYRPEMLLLRDYYLPPYLYQKK